MVDTELNIPTPNQGVTPWPNHQTCRDVSELSTNTPLSYPIYFQKKFYLCKTTPFNFLLKYFCYYNSKATLTTWWTQKQQQPLFWIVSIMQFRLHKNKPSACFWAEHSGRNSEESPPLGMGECVVLKPTKDLDLKKGNNNRIHISEWE